MFGAIWTLGDVQVAIGGFAVALLLAIVLAAVALRNTNEKAGYASIGS